MTTNIRQIETMIKTTGNHNKKQWKPLKTQMEAIIKTNESHKTNETHYTTDKNHYTINENH